MTARGGGVENRYEIEMLPELPCCHDLTLYDG